MAGALQPVGNDVGDRREVRGGWIGPVLPSGDGDAIHPAQPEAAAGGRRAEGRPGLQALENEALGPPDLRSYDRGVVADGVVRRASDRSGLADVYRLADAELDRVRLVRRLRLLLRGGRERNERHQRGQVSSGLLLEHESIIPAFEVRSHRFPEADDRTLADRGRQAGGGELDDVTPVLESPT